MLDILIRDASDNRGSLDDVFRALYREDYLNGRGFTEQEWWSAVSEASGGRSFEDFHAAYVDGREPYPWRELLPLAGLALLEDVHRTALMGVVTSQDDRGVTVVGVTAGGAADAAGVQRGDRLISVGDIAVSDGGFGLRFRDEYGDQLEGTPYDIVVERDGRRLTFGAALDFAESTTLRVEEDATAGPKARRIRNGILTGDVDR